MTRALLALLLLAGCATPPPISEHQAKNPQAFELVDFTWCGPQDFYQCPLIRQGNDLLIMDGPSRIDDGGELWW